MFNQLVPPDDPPIPPVKEEDDEESSNSLLSPLPRPRRMYSSDRFVVMPMGANAVATQTTMAITSSEAAVFIVVYYLFGVRSVDSESIVYLGDWRCSAEMGMCSEFCYDCQGSFHQQTQLCGISILI